MKPQEIIKSTGEIVAFQKEKLQLSLQNVGATEAQIQKILKKVRNDYKNGMKTKDVFKIAFQHLCKHQNEVACKY